MWSISLTLSVDTAYANGTIEATDGNVRFRLEDEFIRCIGSHPQIATLVKSGEIGLNDSIKITIEKIKE